MGRITGEQEEYNSNVYNNIDEKMLNSKISKVFSIFDSALSQGLLSNSFLSFNGGKDCTVLLDLIQSYFRKNSNHKNDKENSDNTLTMRTMATTVMKPIRIIYIQPKNPFKEIEEFVDSCEYTYNVQIERYNGKMRQVLEQICKENPNLKSVIMGSRRSDPHCQNLTTFDPTDPGWPPLIRINPLLDWTTKDIWDYIRFNKIPYCKLYDEGYTSLGDVTNTQKNPHLKYVDSRTGEIKYRPAYTLLDDDLERAGRT